MKFLFCFGILLTVVECQSQKQLSTGGQSMDNVVIFYRSSFAEVKIQGTQGEFIQTEYGYGNTPSATPTSVTRHTFSFSVTPDELKQLLAKLEEIGFWNLDSAYGAPEDQRFYPYRISIHTGKKAKEVIYRSNPSFESPPEAFVEAENLILEFAKSKTQKD